MISHHCHLHILLQTKIGSTQKLLQQQNAILTSLELVLLLMTTWLVYLIVKITMTSLELELLRQSLRLHPPQAVQDHRDCLLATAVLELLVAAELWDHPTING